MGLIAESSERGHYLFRYIVQRVISDTANICGSILKSDVVTGEKL